MRSKLLTHYPIHEDPDIPQHKGKGDHVKRIKLGRNKVEDNN